MISKFEIFPDLYFFDIADSSFYTSDDDVDAYDMQRKLSDNDVYGKVLSYGPKLIRVFTRDCFPLKVVLELSTANNFTIDEPIDLSYTTHSKILVPSGKLEFRGSTADRGPQIECPAGEAAVTIFHCSCDWNEHFLHGMTNENYLIRICPSV